MPNAMTILVGFGIVLNSGVATQEMTVATGHQVQTEIAPGTAIPPLRGASSGGPRFGPSTIVSQPEMNLPDGLAHANTGLLAFGPEGIRLPAYESDIVTGSLASLVKNSGILGELLGTPIIRRVCI